MQLQIEAPDGKRIIVDRKVLTGYMLNAMAEAGYIITALTEDTVLRKET